MCFQLGSIHIQPCFDCLNQRHHDFLRRYPSIETPVIAAMAKNGIQVKAIARVTVRANIDRLVGGAGEETIIARVGEGIVSTVGSAESHKDVLENPDNISKTVLAKGLDYRNKNYYPQPFHRPSPILYLLSDSLPSGSILGNLMDFIEEADKQLASAGKENSKKEKSVAKV